MRSPFGRARKALAVTAVAALAATGLAACGGSGNSNEVIIWTSVDQKVFDGLQAAMDRKTQGMDFTVKFQKVDSIDKLIKTKIQAGDVPDIAMVPQPGVVKSIVDLGAAYPMEDTLDMNTLNQSMVPGTLDAGTFDGHLYGLLVSMNVKSLLFYPKKAFDAAGYQVPDSIPALNALTDQIRNDGGTPWCLTMESGDATGWVATDWFEDLVMRYGGVQTYNDWVAGKVKFNSPVVKQAAAEFEKLAFTNGNVLGGRKGIVATSYTDAAKPMFDAAGPKCWLLHMGSYVVSSDFLPASVFANADSELGVAAFPPATAGGDNPVLGGGDLAVLMHDTANAKAALKLLSETDIGNEAAPNSSFISPHLDFDKTLYPSETTRRIADVAYNASAFLFDGSDAMPAAVGAGSFWKEMTAWINGDESLDTAQTNIDKSWPTS